MSSLPAGSVIERWSFVNAVGVLAAAVWASMLSHVGPLLAAGIALLGGLVGVGRDRWTPCGNFGAANVVTAVRIVLLAGLPVAASVGPGSLIVLSLSILAMDGVDGWLARRRGQSSEFGAFFDKETDALFLLVLCGLAAFRGRLPIWILGAGLLRYGFVLLLFFTPPVENTEERSNLARYVYGGMIVALLMSFLPYPTLYRPLALLATSALVASFGQSLWRMMPRAFSEKA